MILLLIVFIAIILLSKVRLLFAIAGFAYPNAKFNAIGNIYVNYSELEQLSALGSLRNAVDRIASKRYPIKNLEKMTEIEHIILLSELKAFKDAMSTVPGSLKPLVRCYLLKWEIRYLKNLLAEKYLKKSSLLKRVEELPGVYLDSEMLMQLSESGSVSDTLNLLSKTEYRSRLKELTERQSEIRFAELEQILDRVFFEELNAVKAKLPSAIAKPTRDFIDLTNDVTNVKILLRSKHLGLHETRTKKLLHAPGRQLSEWRLTELAGTHSVPELVQVMEGTDYHELLDKKLKDYSATGDIQLMESVVDKFYLNSIVNLSLESSLTVGPTIRFIISQEYETRNLTALLRGLMYREPNESIMALTVYEQKLSEI